MEFSIKNYAMSAMRSGKRHMTEKIEILKKEKIEMFGEKETYKYFGILEADTIKQVEMKE